MKVRTDLPPPVRGDELSQKMQELRHALPTIPVGGCVELKPIRGVDLPRLHRNAGAVVAYHGPKGAKFTTSSKGLGMVRVWRLA